MDSMEKSFPKGSMFSLFAIDWSFLFLKTSLITKKQLCFVARFFANMKLIESIDQRYTLDKFRIKEVLATNGILYL